MAEKKFKGISVITAGPALGHDMVIDETTLEQVVELGNTNAPVKVLANHSNDVGAILGMLENFRIDGPRVRADLELLENHPQAEYYAELLGKLPDQLGFSISFSGIPRMAEDGTVLADVRDLWSVDLVTRAAANKSIYSAKPVDTAKVAMAQTIETKEVKLEAAAEAAPAAPAAPVAVFNAEEAIAALAAKIEILSKQFADLVTTKLEAAVVETAPVDEAPVAEPTPEPVAAEAKVEETVVEAPADNTAAALKAEVATMKIELEASRGTKPLETSAPQNFSRAELIAQFNAEKDPRRAAEIFNKIKLAR